MGVLLGASYLMQPGYMAIGHCWCQCFGFWLGRLGKTGKDCGVCSSRQGSFGDMAGFEDLGLQLGYRILEDVFSYRYDLLPIPRIPLALGLNVVTTWGGNSVDDGTRDECIFCQGQEQYLLVQV